MSTNRSNIQFTTFSIIRYFKDVIFNVILIYILFEIYLYLNTVHNPVVLIFGILISLVLLLNSTIEINLYKTCLVIKRVYFFRLFSHKTRFNLSEINELTFEGNFSKKSDLIEDILSFIIFPLGAKNTLKIHTKRKTYQYRVYIYKEKLRKIAEMVNTK